MILSKEINIVLGSSERTKTLFVASSAFNPRTFTLFSIIINNKNNYFNKRYKEYLFKNVNSITRLRVPQVYRTSFGF